ncbi:ankyrin repeats (3 copies) domain-containing protein [Ditylenchus destructor]|uniref:Ankyrin repeats (3 copies) domain-containing protein n=1 Tax=Ditylenchus destructor TaxID=166010 RepID=A0AAD4R4R8_9BILA|nr:ankyrin repeats (3 copies) domain-containing protein [Ditylenchus destructor]
MCDKLGQFLNDCSPVLFNAAKDGNVDRIRKLVGAMPQEALKRYLNKPFTNGATPLIIAARNGHSKCVEYLLKLGADPSTSGTVSFDGEIISRVPPLWAASAAGHFEVCKILIKHNVDVNQTSSTNSTPLRGACYDGHLEIVKFLVDNGADFEIPNRHGHTPLMISCFRGKAEVVKYLLSIGADVNARGARGSTALHDAAEIGHKEIVDMLLEAGAKIQPDDSGVTPLFCAAMFAATEVMPIFFAYASRKERRDAWKLLGATMVDKRMDLGSAIQCWKSAFSLAIVGPKDTPEYSDDFHNYPEFDINNLIGDPEAIRMQALIIRERILGESHPETHYYLRYRGAMYLDLGRWDRTYDLWLYILQLEQYYFEPMNMSAATSIVSFLDTFSTIVDDLLIHPERQQYYGQFGLALEQVIVVMERAIYEAERYLRSEADCEFVHQCERDIRQEVENLLSVILQFLHLVNRVHCLNMGNQNVSTDIARLSNQLATYSVNQGRMPQSPPSLAVPNLPSSPMPNTSRRKASLNHHMLSSGNAYLLGHDVPLCSNAYIASLMDRIPPRPKAELPLQPTCNHLNCLVWRTIGIFSLLKMNPMHMACEEQDNCQIGFDTYQVRRSPSRFVIEKLIHVGADLRKTDDRGNTPLHILLSGRFPRSNIVKLMLDAGAPLLARSEMTDLTCLGMIRRACPEMIRQLRIGKYMSLKQLAANQVMRNLSGKATFTDILPQHLEEYISIF